MLRFIKKMIAVSSFTLLGVILGAYLMIELSEKYFDRDREVKDRKHLELYLMMVKWLTEAERYHFK